MKTNKPTVLIKPAIAVVLLCILDQLTKIWAYGTLRVQGKISLIKDVLSFTYLENRGAAWGMLEGARFLFVIIAACITLIAGYIYLRMPRDKKYNFLRFTIVLLVSGAIGNVIDRLVRSFVVDFIYFELIDFPIFNVADIYITCSAILLVLLVFFYYKESDFAFLERKN